MGNDAQPLETALEKAKTTLTEKSDNKEELQKAYDELLQASHKLAEIMYAEKQGQSAGSGEQANPEEPVDVDAEIKE